MKDGQHGQHIASSNIVIVAVRQWVSSSDAALSESSLQTLSSLVKMQLVVVAMMKNTVF